MTVFYWVDIRSLINILALPSSVVLVSADLTGLQQPNKNHERFYRPVRSWVAFTSVFLCGEKFIEPHKAGRHIRKPFVISRVFFNHGGKGGRAQRVIYFY
ncbi:MAG: hypothetical protein JST58_05075 [Bacteroidetes bacterium]|nr:hypothetical protein [Bacteroidota bacterium]